MSTLLLSLPVRRGRDVLLARQRSRQIASLLGFEGLERTAISALVVGISLEALSVHENAQVEFALSDGRLQVRCQAVDNLEANSSATPPVSSSYEGGDLGRVRARRRAFVGPLSQFYPGMQAEVDRQGGLRTLTFPLPEEPPRMEVADLPWMVQELDDHTPLDPLEELSHWNQEILQLTQLARAYGFFGEPAAQAA